MCSLRKSWVLADAGGVILDHASLSDCQVTRASSLVGVCDMTSPQCALSTALVLLITSGSMFSQQVGNCMPGLRSVATIQAGVDSTYDSTLYVCPGIYPE